ncbi:McrB family protein [Maribacter aurantiacus]|nr:AAA family ATPase [Maribacter aurantiacus]
MKSKKDLMHFFNTNHNAQMSNGNTSYAMANTNNGLWWLNIDLKKFKSVVNIILQTKNEAFWLQLNPGFVEDLATKFRIRPDRNAIDLEIVSTAGDDYMHDTKNGGSGFNFNPYIKASVTLNVNGSQENKPTYWHIQMNQPENRNGIVINSVDLLKEKTPVIGTGEWDDLQCDYFKGNVEDAMEVGDVVLVREGVLPIALVSIQSDSFTSEELRQKYINVNYREVKILDWYVGTDTFPVAQGTLGRLTNKNTPSYKFIDRWFNRINTTSKMDELIKILEYKKQIILQGPPGTGKTFTAKEIAYQLITKNSLSKDTLVRKQQLEQTEFKDFCELIQFHPAYSYEDFVRGIVAETQGEKVHYVTKNKILAKLAKKAKDNLDRSEKSLGDLKQDERYQNALEALIDKVQTEIDTSETSKYFLTNSGFIFDCDDEYFRYTGDAWSSSFRIPFDELITIAKNNLRSRQEIKKSREVRGSSRQHATYLWKLMEEYYKILDTYPVPTQIIKENAKKYVLIIDEINRANLPAVLGELIYALEYRNQPVNTLYPIAEDYKITLPENLYIIGTMNTADRSVGHIDYAIRRRFAFVNVLPDSSIVPEFAKSHFRSVANLFTEDYLSSDYKREDVQIGHSYFLGKEEELPLKINNEVIPILKEYVTDGVLSHEALDEIEKLRIEA